MNQMLLLFLQPAIFYVPSALSCVLKVFSIDQPSYNKDIFYAPDEQCSPQLLSGHASRKIQRT